MVAQGGVDALGAVGEDAGPDAGADEVLHDVATDVPDGAVVAMVESRCRVPGAGC